MESRYLIDMRNGVPIYATAYSMTISLVYELSCIFLLDNLKAAAGHFIRIEMNLTLRDELTRNVALQLLETGLQHGWSWSRSEFRDILENTRLMANLKDLREGTK